MCVYVARDSRPVTRRREHGNKEDKLSGEQVGKREREREKKILANVE